MGFVQWGRWLSQQVATQFAHIVEDRTLVLTDVFQKREAEKDLRRTTVVPKKSACPMAINPPALNDQSYLVMFGGIQVDEVRRTSFPSGAQSRCY